MTRILFLSIVVLVFTTKTAQAQNFEHKTLISGMGNFSKYSSTNEFENASSSSNSSKNLQTELSVVYFLNSKIALGFSGAFANTSDTYSSRQTSGLFSTGTTDSVISRETGGALRLDVMLLEKNKFSFGLRSSGGTYISVRRSVLTTETINPPSSISNSTEQTTRGSVLRISVVPVLYYEISKHVLAQFQYASIFYSTTKSEILPPAKQNGRQESAYGLNLNYSSLALGLSLLF